MDTTGQLCAMQRHTLITQRTARYFTLGEADTANAHWIALHGYGQQAEYFIRHFEHLPQTHVVAVEGLSKFYLDGLGGRIGASWMTALDRDLEIADQAAYLDRVLKCEIPTGTLPVVMGFSQGATTAARWVVNQKIKVRAMVLWAGNLPHDVPLATLAEHWQNTPVHVVLGHDDPFIKVAELHEKLAPVREALPLLEVHTFAGAHVMHAPTLAAIHHSIINPKNHA